MTGRAWRRPAALGLVSVLVTVGLARRVVNPTPSGSPPPSTSIAVRNGTAVLVGQLETPGGNGLIGATWTAPASILGR